jgi:GNAT superfamily N-acetyltransferase
MDVAPLSASSPWVTEIARVQFAHWGPLTGQASLEAYEAFLRQAAAASSLPKTLVAHEGPSLLGSVNLLACEMTIRPELTPWMGQLFVREDARGRGVGERLVAAAAAYARSLGFARLYLFTSGTLPDYYRSLGWQDFEVVEYLGRSRTVMCLAIATPSLERATPIAG